MEWLKQANPHCSTSTLQAACREANWDYVQAARNLRSRRKLAKLPSIIAQRLGGSSLSVRASQPAVSKTGKKFDTNEDLEKV